jgi:hypothetical protein
LKGLAFVWVKEPHRVLVFDIFLAIDYEATYGNEVYTYANGFREGRMMFLFNDRFYLPTEAISILFTTNYYYIHIGFKLAIPHP